MKKGVSRASEVSIYPTGTVSSKVTFMTLNQALPNSAIQTAFRVPTLHLLRASIAGLTAETRLSWLFRGIVNAKKGVSIWEMEFATSRSTLNFSR